MTSTCPICGENHTTRISPYKNTAGRFLSADSILNCLNCGMTFAAPRPDDEELNQYYLQGEYYRKTGHGDVSSKSFFLEMARSRIRFITQNTTIGTVGRCLDVGAGKGVFGLALTETALSLEYHAVEPDSSCRDYFTNRVSGYYENISQVVGVFDLVVANQVLEHVARPVSFLHQLTGFLSANGILFIEVPYRDDLYKSDVEPHIQFWDISTLPTALSKAGLEIVKCQSVGMARRKAARLFRQPKALVDKITDPWAWAGKVNQICNRIGTRFEFDLNRRFELDNYGGERQWLRCLARPIGS